MIVHPHVKEVKIVDELKIEFSGIEIMIYQNIKMVAGKTNVIVRGENIDGMKEKVEKIIDKRKLSRRIGEQNAKKVGTLVSSTAKKCEACDGKGLYVGFDDHDPESLHNITCHRCNGTGKLVT